MLLLIVLAFQVTVLPDTLGIKGIGRILNGLALAWFLTAGLYALVSGRAAKAPLAYIVPVLLVITGMSINIGRTLSPESVGAAGALLAWAAASSVPFMRSFDLNRSWRLFYRFMVLASIVAVLEYLAVFSGLLQPTIIETDRGLYLKGVVTIFNGLDDGTAYYRMYGLFAEPGTYAMYLLPAIAYAWLRGKRWAAAFLTVCLLLTDSLGGIASLLVLVATYFFWRSSKRPIGLVIALLLSSGLLYTVSGPLRDRFSQKGASKTIREDNVTLFRDNFVAIVSANPFGLPQTGQSLSELKNVTDNYLGSNFEIYTVFVKGGIIACVGYTILLIWILLRTIRYLLSSARDQSRSAALVCMPAMLLFIVQRDTVLSSALFGFLFAEPLLAVGHLIMPTEDKPPVKRRRDAQPSVSTLSAEEC